MNNSFIRTATGLVLVINNQPYTVEQTHKNYGEIVEALRTKRWEDIPDLINITAKLKVWAAATDTEQSSLEIDTVGGVILFNGENVRGTIATRILDMFTDGFDITPMRLYLERLYKNPSNRAVEELYRWQEANGITITEDGYLLAFKRVRDDYMSFYDGTTANFVGTYVSLPRNKVDDRSNNTCSHGLHFCSQEYLPSYHGGQGRVLLLKIDPADVVSIPTDYNNAKGRACRYLILDELKGDSRSGIETHNVIPQPVITEQTDYNATNAFQIGYAAGYKDGRGKKAQFASWDNKYDNSEAAQADPTSYAAGYKAGRDDGRHKKPNLYSGIKEVYVPPAPNDGIITRVCNVIAEQLGVPSSEVTADKHIIADLGADSLDTIELVMACEDEFSTEISDELAEACETVQDVVDLIVKLTKG